ncbi:hypothetical protein GPECTOR_13g737 [Gonium pectorale]|uniref:Transcription initiation factor TFIID subunit 12 domain-containing protein n=1 Tax=Gonium pectorale TaxID=33097 RepID=A0A150GPJ2_GONPE|nr:hypothetical protein GPECTOR_13g737 [Gonium pectorale]|eukprot:KXZ51250.1 hypothetical protein GPECTOR_13g737 [Gonium pectorale]
MNPGMAPPGPQQLPGMPGVNVGMMPGHAPGYNQGLAQPRPQAGMKRPNDHSDDDGGAKRQRADGEAIVRPPSAGPGPGPDLTAAAALMPAAAAAVAAAAAGAAGGGVRPPVNPLAIIQAQMIQQAQAAHAAQQAQQAAAARAQRARQAQQAEDADDAHKVLPRRGIRMAMRAAGMEQDYKVDPATENALLEFYYEWIGNAIAMGCEVAKRRKSNVLKARDIALHLERSWNLYVPGFSGEILRPYRRPSASEAHRQRQGAVRRTAAELDRELQQQYGSGGGASGAGGGAAAGGSGGGGGSAQHQIHSPGAAGAGAAGGGV